jgi:general secretion pathway protein B
MSYILEALKKAQAERQLGNAPTIHAAQAVPLVAAPVAANRKPLLIGVAAGVLVAGAAATFVWRQQAPVQVAVLAPAAAGGVTAAPVPAPAVAAPVPATPVADTSVAHPGPAVASPAPAAVEPVATVPAVPAPKPARKPRAGQDRQPAASAPAGQDVAPPAASPLQPPAPAAAKSPAPAAVAQEYVRTLAELPETIRREVPKVAFGGYMYSPNPADRLVLVDKTLRHEGEELAPGLVLEKLLPKAAVLSYRGYRYRVGL